tara:strand:+ start:25245 stop:25436 length:192 start_codon:yes stop_codon:yes gene_type:complete
MDDVGCVEGGKEDIRKDNTTTERVVSNIYYYHTASFVHETSISYKRQKKLSLRKYLFVSKPSY